MALRKGMRKYLEIETLRTKVHKYEERRVEIRKYNKANPTTDPIEKGRREWQLKNYRDQISRWKKILKKRTAIRSNLREFEVLLNEYAIGATLFTKNSRRNDLTHFKHMGFKYLIEKGFDPREVASFLKKKRADVISQGRLSIQRKFQKDLELKKEWWRFKDYFDDYFVKK